MSQYMRPNVSLGRNDYKLDIVDDLIKRNIVQISSSSYCARVQLYDCTNKKKNSSLRFCIDCKIS